MREKSRKSCQSTSNAGSLRLLQTWAQLAKVLQEIRSSSVRLNSEMHGRLSCARGGSR